MRQLVTLIALGLLLILMMMFCECVLAQASYGRKSIRWDRTPPTSPTSSGTYPSISEDDTYMYITISPNNWRRVTLVDWSVSVTGVLLLEGGSNKLLLEGGTNKLSLE